MSEWLIFLIDGDEGSYPENKKIDLRMDALNFDFDLVGVKWDFDAQ